MDINQILPLLMKGKLGEREAALLNATKSSDPAVLGDLLTQMYKQKKPQVNLYALLKKIMPAQTLGQVIKYFDTLNDNR